MFHGLSHQQVVLDLDPRTCLVRNKDYRVRLQVCEMERNHYRKQLGLLVRFLNQSILHLDDPNRF